MFQRQPRLYLKLSAKLPWSCVNHPGGTGFEGMKGTWRAAKARHCERLGKAIGEGAASVTVEGLGLRESCREVEAWHHEESSGEAIDEWAAQLERRCLTLQMPIP